MKFFPTKCRCGKSSLNFKQNIGDFYIDECCISAGYDHLGNLKKKDESQQLVGPGEKIVAPEEKPKKKRTYNRSGNVKIDEQS